MFQRFYRNFADAYESMLISLINNPQFITRPRGMLIHEIMNAQIRIENPQSCLFTNKIRNLPLDYLVKELCLYFSGTNELKHFKNASSFWEKIANLDGTINSAYGNLIFNSHTLDNNDNISQFDWAYNSLVKDKDSRQAIMHFNRARHCNPANKDFPCTLYGIFHVRNNKLNFKISMRSNDIFLGVTFDIPFFCILQMVMLQKLRETKYPNLELGTYVHCADSLHLYERNFEVASDMVNYEFRSHLTPMPPSRIIKHSVLLRIFDGSYREERQDGDHEFVLWLNDCINIKNP